MQHPHDSVASSNAPTATLDDTRFAQLSAALASQSAALASQSALLLAALQELPKLRAEIAELRPLREEMLPLRAEIAELRTLRELLPERKAARKARERVQHRHNFISAPRRTGTGGTWSLSSRCAGRHGGRSACGTR